MLTELERRLARELKKISRNDDFLMAIFSYCKGEKEQKKILDYILAGDDVNDQTVMLLAIYLHRHKGEIPHE